MRKQIKHVKKFHESFGIDNQLIPNANISEKTYKLRYKLCRKRSNFVS